MVLGALVGVVGVLVRVPGTGLLEVAVALLPVLVAGAVASGACAWARRRGDLP